MLVTWDLHETCAWPEAHKECEWSVGQHWVALQEHCKSRWGNMKWNTSPSITDSSLTPNVPTSSASLHINVSFHIVLRYQRDMLRWMNSFKSYTLLDYQNKLFLQKYFSASTPSLWNSTEELTLKCYVFYNLSDLLHEESLPLPESTQRRDAAL